MSSFTDPTSPGQTSDAVEASSSEVTFTGMAPGWLTDPRADMSSGTGRGPNGRSTLQTAVSRAPTHLQAAPVARCPHSPERPGGREVPCLQAGEDLVTALGAHHRVNVHGQG